MTQQRLADAPFVAVLGASVVVNIVVLRQLLDAYLGLSARRYIYGGPRLSWLAEKAQDASWTMGDHIPSVLTELQGYSIHNTHVASGTADVRRRALLLLFVALVGYSVSALYILARTVVA